MRKINFDTFIQTIILCSTIFLLVLGLKSGRINKYVHPRYNISIWLSVIVLLFFVVSLYVEKRKGRHNISYQRYLLYLIPLVLAFAFQPSANGNTNVVLADSSSTETVEANVQNEQSDSEETPDINNDKYLEDTQSQIEEEVSSMNQQDSTMTDKSEAYQTNEVDGYYVIEDEVFADWFMDIYDHVDDFVGENYQYVAQVYSMEGLEKNQFLAGREFMVCCAADLVGYGLICESDIRSDLKENQWIIVKATVSKGEYEGSEVPMLINTEIKTTKAPDDEYIYYNGY